MWVLETLHRMPCELDEVTPEEVTEAMATFGAAKEMTRPPDRTEAH